MQHKIRELARLVDIQRLRKMEHETKLALIQKQIGDMEAERRALEELQDRYYEGVGTFIPLTTIVARLDLILKRKDGLEVEAERERHALLAASRRLDRAGEKHAAEKRHTERVEGAKALEEALPHLIIRSRTSLP